MALTTVAVPREYGYVLTATAATFFLGFWHGIYAGTFRRAAGVFPPKLFAEASDIEAADNAEKKAAMNRLNCAQRAHGNFNESHPSVAIAMLIGGLRYPTAAAGMGAAWMVARVLYTIGYTSPKKSNGKGRVPGFILSALMQVGLWGMAGWTGLQLIL